MLSIIIPVLDWIEYTKQILQEIKDKTKLEYEVLLLISGYDTQTRHNEEILSQVNDYCIMDKDDWVNWAWNEWVRQAKWEYIAILNNDILLCDWRDEKLIEWLGNHKLSSPYYTVWNNVWWTIYKHNRFQEKNICWHCYLIRKSDRQEIPEDIKIRFWDNFIYKYIDWDQVAVEDCVIHHFESKTIKNEDFADIINERILQDKFNWAKIK